MELESATTARCGSATTGSSRPPTAGSHPAERAPAAAGAGPAAGRRVPDARAVAAEQYLPAVDGGAPTRRAPPGRRPVPARRGPGLRLINTRWPSGSWPPRCALLEPAEPTPDDRAAGRRADRAARRAVQPRPPGRGRRGLPRDRAARPRPAGARRRRLRADQQPHPPRPAGRGGGARPGPAAPGSGCGVTGPATTRRRDRAALRRALPSGSAGRRTGRRPAPARDQRPAGARPRRKLINRLHAAGVLQRPDAIMAWLVAEASGSGPSTARAPPCVGPLGPRRPGHHRAPAGLPRPATTRSGTLLAVSEARGYEPETSQARFLVRGERRAHWFEPLEDGVAQAQRAREACCRRRPAERLLHLPRLAARAAGLRADPGQPTPPRSRPASRSRPAPATSTSTDSLLPLRQLLRALRGETPAPGGFTDAALRRGGLPGRASATTRWPRPTSTSTARLVGAPSSATPTALRRARRGGDAAAARTSAASTSIALAYLLRALALADTARAPPPPTARRPPLLAELDACRDWLARRAADAPANFGHLLRLRRGRAGLGGRRPVGAASRSTPRCARSPARQRPWHHALIAERAALFHLGHGSTTPGARCSPRRAGPTEPGARPRKVRAARPGAPVPARRRRSGGSRARDPGTTVSAERDRPARRARGVPGAELGDQPRPAARPGRRGAQRDDRRHRRAAPAVGRRPAGLVPARPPDGGRAPARPSRWTRPARGAWCRCRRSATPSAPASRCWWRTRPATTGSPATRTWPAWTAARCWSCRSSARACCARCCCWRTGSAAARSPPTGSTRSCSSPASSPSRWTTRCCTRRWSARSPSAPRRWRRPTSGWSCSASPTR